MGEFFLSNSKGRDAQVMAESVRSTLKVRWLDDEGRQVASHRVLKATVERDLDALLARFGDLEKVGAALTRDDPEIDLERVGSFLHDTSRVYIDTQKKVVHRVKMFDVIRNPDGSERLRRPHAVLVPNVTADQPLKWTGKLLPKKEVFNKFVISGKMQLVHINGLTYDFLFGIAKELEQKDALLMLGAGPKSTQPLVLRRGSTPYRGFLEGRTRGDEYCLLVHLSNMELKAPEVKSPEAAAPEAKAPEEQS
jgi:hypothetical protein